ncbi:MAG: sugar ABC transporter substrate-binding protein [Clostridia bacterium]
MKKTLAFLVVLVLSLLMLTGVVALAEDTTVEFVIWGNDARKAEYDRIFTPFTEKTGIKVNVNLVALEETVAKLATQIVSGTAPDVVWLTEAQLPQFIATGNLEDISEIMGNEAYDFGDLFPGLVEKYIKDGKLYAVPFTSSPRVYFYNKDMFAEAGLQDPQELAEKGEWTMDKMLEYARAMTSKEKGTYGLSIMNYQSPNDWNILLDWTWSMGASFFDEDMTKVTINDENGIKALQMYSDMIFKDGSQPLPGEQIDFASGKIGMTRNTISFQAQLKDASFEWDIIPNPKGTALDAPIAVGVAAYVVPKGAKNKAAALQVIEYITSKESMSDNYLMNTFSPIRTSVLSSEKFLEGERPSPRGKLLALLAPWDGNTRLYPVHDNYTAIDLKIKEMMDLLYTQACPIEELCQRIETEVTPLLTDY